MSGGVSLRFCRGLRQKDGGAGRFARNDVRANHGRHVDTQGCLWPKSFLQVSQDVAKLTEALDVYEPIANNILAIVAMAFIREREKVVLQQQEAIRELSTPVLQVREGLLILPIIGLIDSFRAKQLTEQLLRAIRDNRAKAVVIDITGVPAVDSKIANHILQTVDAARLMGARVIVTGLSPEVAQALVTIGVDLTRLKTVGDLQGGIEEADKLLGYGEKERNKVNDNI